MPTGCYEMARAVAALRSGGSCATLLRKGATGSDIYWLWTTAHVNT